MAASTPNYDLRVPSSADEVDVMLDIAENMVKIDAAIREMADAGIAIYISDTAPPTPNINVVWIDTSGGG